MQFSVEHWNFYSMSNNELCCVFDIINVLLTEWGLRTHIYIHKFAILVGSKDFANNKIGIIKLYKSYLKKSDII